MLRPSKRYLFFIQDSSGKSYYLDGYDSMGKAVIKSATLVPTDKSLWLNFNPKGWQDTEIGFGKNDKYFAIFRSFTEPFKFIEDGAEIMRYLFYKKGFAEKVYMINLQHNGNTDTYENFYKGQIDLTEIDDDAGASCSVNLIEGGLLYYFLKNDSVTYEIPCNPSNPDAIPIYFDGVTLFDKYNYIIVGDIDFHGLNYYAIPLFFSSNEGDSVGIIQGTQSYEVIGLSFTSYVNDSGNYFFSSATNLTGVRIRGSIKVFHDSIYQYFLSIQTSAGHSYKIVDYDYSVPGETNTFDFDFTVNAANGEKFFFILGQQIVDPLVSNIIKVLETKFSIEFTSINSPSASSAFAPLYVLQQLIDKMTDGKYTAQSNFFTRHSNIFLTSGEALRELKDPVSGVLTAVLKTSFEDFYKSYNVIYKLGCRIVNNILYIEPQEDFLTSATIFDAGEVSDLNITLDKEMLFNTIKAGYPKQDYSERNGRYEFNDTKEYSLQIVPNKKTLDLVSKYRADCYGIEFIRGKLNNKDTTDNKGDDECFFVNVVNQSQVTATFPFEFAGSTLTFKLTGQAALLSSFPVGKVFIIDSTIGGTPAFSNFIFTVGSANVTGTDLNIIVNENPGVVTAASASGKVTFPARLRRENYTSLTGVPTNTVYNIEELTPARIVDKWGNYIRSVNFQYGSEKVMYQTSDKNKDLVTTLSGVTIVEKADRRIDTFAAPYFYPLILSVTSKIPDTFLSIMNASTSGQVGFSFNGTLLFGFPRNMTIRPVLNDAQKWKLLASTANNIDDLLNLDPLLINDDNMSTYRLSFSHLCPLQKVPIGNVILPQYNTVHMDQGLWTEQIQNYIQRKNYLQKWQTNDIIKLQCYTNDLGPVQEDLFDIKGRHIDTISYQLIATSALQAPYQLYEANINLQNYPPGRYYSITTAGISAAQVQFISEGIDLRTVHPRTKLFNYTNRKNKLSTIFTTGYNPDFRIEADIKDFEPGLHYSAYEDEPADMDLIESIPFRKFMLEIGKGSHDQSVFVPPYMIDKLNRIMGLNTVQIDGKRYTRNGEDAQFEAERVPGVPGAIWKMPIREGLNRQAVTLGTDGNLEKTALVAYNIDTGLFGDFSGQVSSNVIQVTKAENVQ